MAGEGRQTDYCRYFRTITADYLITDYRCLTGGSRCQTLKKELAERLTDSHRDHQKEQEESGADKSDSQEGFKVDAAEEVSVDFNRFTVETNLTSFRIQNHIRVKSH